MNTNLRIEKGEIYTITVAADTATVLSSAVVWVQHEPPAQETRHAAIAANASLTLGPYLDAANFRIESEGSISISQIGIGSTPSKLVDAMATDMIAAVKDDVVMPFVDDATDEIDVVTQFNLLRDALVTAGLMEADV